MNVFKKIIKTATKPIVNNIRGKVGEAKVQNKLSPLIIGKNSHRLLNGLIIMDRFGNSHQIDHIEIRKNGIFCIETKNYIGLILGNDKEENWIQILGNNEKRFFRNPIKQNSTHAFMLEKVLGSKYKINSLIVMVQNNANTVEASNVINLTDLKDYIKNFNDGTKLDTHEIEDIYQKLLKVSAKISNRQHVKNIKNTQKEIEKGICPRCGGKLVKRKGEFGEFIGCSNYPKCKFVLKNKK